MYELFLLVLAAAFALRSVYSPYVEPNDLPHKIGTRMAKLWDVAQKGMHENKFLRAEKALLTILKIDEKNAAAYNRLGILYAKQKEYDDAIDCFQIASTIDRSPSSLHNLGLIYFETEKYEKAAIAFKQAIDLEHNLAARHIAYAKVLERMGRDKEMLQELETAVQLETNQETLNLLLKSYQSRGMNEEADRTQARLKTLIHPVGKSRRVRRPSRAVV